MPDLFTGTPESLDDAGTLLANYNGGVGRIFGGARIFGSDIYYPAYQNQGALATNIHMMKRAVSGGSWTSLDQANTPVLTGANAIHSGSSKPAIWDGPAQVVRFLG